MGSPSWPKLWALSLSHHGLTKRKRSEGRSSPYRLPIIVSGASAWMAPHHDRMPVLLGESDIAGWLDSSLGGEALRPAAESTLREWIVSTRVNKTGEGDDDPTFVQPLAKVGFGRTG